MIDLTIAVPVIMAIVSAAKTAGLPSKFAAIVSILIGVIGFYFMGSAEIVVNIFDGVLAGLAASGLYSGAKATLK